MKIGKIEHPITKGAIIGLVLGLTIKAVREGMHTDWMVSIPVWLIITWCVLLPFTIMVFWGPKNRSVVVSFLGRVKAAGRNVLKRLLGK